MARCLGALIGLLVVGTGAGRAQFASTTEIVEVYATVTDASGQPVPGLAADAFTVLEDGAAQPVTVFTAGEFPLSVVMAVDRSFSMTARGLEVAKAGARRLADQLRAHDRLLILAIGGGVETLAGFDTAREAARQAIDRVSLWGSSPIGDTVTQAIDAVAPQRGRRAVVVWSDGAEREATRGRGEVLDHLRRADVLVYPVAIAAQTSPLLSELAAVSGGRVLQARSRSSAERAAALIAAELRSQYLLGYAPAAGGLGWRRIEVRVNRPHLRVRARQGYFAGPAAPRTSPPGAAASNDIGVR